MIIAHYLEIPAVICGFLNIFLAARANILNWLFGIATVILYFIIFLQTKLYANMSLQLVFLFLQFYGWYHWLYGSERHTALAIRKTSLFVLVLALLSVLILFVMISYILASYTDSMTIYSDALIAALSLVAQWMMCNKWLENWLVWMLVDVISVRLYFFKQLYFTTFLYAVLFLICLYGYISWRRTLNDNKKL